MTDHIFIFNDISKNNLTFILKSQLHSQELSLSVVEAPTSLSLSSVSTDKCATHRGYARTPLQGPGCRPAVELR